MRAWMEYAATGSEGLLRPDLVPPERIAGCQRAGVVGIELQGDSAATHDGPQVLAIERRWLDLAAAENVPGPGGDTRATGSAWSLRNRRGATSPAARVRRPATGWPHRTGALFGFAASCEGLSHHDRGHSCRSPPRAEPAVPRAAGPKSPAKKTPPVRGTEWRGFPLRRSLNGR